MVDTVLTFLGLMPLPEITTVGALLPYMVNVTVGVSLVGIVFRALVELIALFVPSRWQV